MTYKGYANSCVSLWIRPSNDSATFPLFDIKGSVFVEVVSGSLKFYSYDGENKRLESTFSSSTIISFDWNHIAINFNPGSLISVYINGNSFIPEMICKERPIGADFLVMPGFTGQIDNIDVYEDEITQSMARSIYHKDKSLRGNGDRFEDFLWNNYSRMVAYAYSNQKNGIIRYHDRHGREKDPFGNIIESENFPDLYDFGTDSIECRVSTLESASRSSSSLSFTFAPLLHESSYGQEVAIISQDFPRGILIKYDGIERISVLMNDELGSNPVEAFSFLIDRCVHNTIGVNHNVSTGISAFCNGKNVGVNSSVHFTGSMPEVINASTKLCAGTSFPFYMSHFIMWDSEISSDEHSEEYSMSETFTKMDNSPLMTSINNLQDPRCIYGLYDFSGGSYVQGSVYDNLSGLKTVVSGNNYISEDLTLPKMNRVMNLYEDQDVSIDISASSYGTSGQPILASQKSSMILNVLFSDSPTTIFAMHEGNIDGVGEVVSFIADTSNNVISVQSNHAELKKVDIPIDLSGLSGKWSQISVRMDESSESIHIGVADRSAMEFYPGLPFNFSHKTFLRLNSGSVKKVSVIALFRGDFTSDEKIFISSEMSQSSPVVDVVFTRSSYSDRYFHSLTGEPIFYVPEGRVAGVPVRGLHDGDAYVGINDSGDYELEAEELIQANRSYNFKIVTPENNVSGESGRDIFSISKIIGNHSSATENLSGVYCCLTKYPNTSSSEKLAIRMFSDYHLEEMSTNGPTFESSVISTDTIYDTGEELDIWLIINSESVARAFCNGKFIGDFQLDVTRLESQSLNPEADRIRLGNNFHGVNPGDVHPYQKSNSSSANSIKFKRVRIFDREVSDHEVVLETYSSGPRNVTKNFSISYNLSRALRLDDTYSLRYELGYVRVVEIAKYFQYILDQTKEYFQKMHDFSFSYNLESTGVIEYGSPFGIEFLPDVASSRNININFIYRLATKEDATHRYGFPYYIDNNKSVINFDLYYFSNVEKVKRTSDLLFSEYSLGIMSQSSHSWSLPSRLSRSIDSEVYGFRIGYSMEFMSSKLRNFRVWYNDKGGVKDSERVFNIVYGQDRGSPFGNINTQKNFFMKSKVTRINDEIESKRFAFGYNFGKWRENERQYTLPFLLERNSVIYSDFIAPYSLRFVNKLTERSMSYDIASNSLSVTINCENLDKVGHRLLIDNGSRYISFNKEFSLGKNIIGSGIEIEFDYDMDIPNYSYDRDNPEIIRAEDVYFLNGQFGWRDAKSELAFGEGVVFQTGVIRSLGNYDPYSDNASKYRFKVEEEGYYVFDSEIIGSENCTLYLIDETSNRVINFGENNFSDNYLAESSRARIVAYLPKGFYRLCAMTNSGTIPSGGLRYYMGGYRKDFGHKTDESVYDYGTQLKESLPDDYLFDVHSVKILIKGVDAKSTMSIDLLDQNMDPVDVDWLSFVPGEINDYYSSEIINSYGPIMKAKIKIPSPCCVSKKPTIDQSNLCRLTTRRPRRNKKNLINSPF